jgi:hypothetical protein
MNAYCFILRIREGECKGKQGLVPSIEFQRDRAKARAIELRRDNPAFDFRIVPVEIADECFEGFEVPKTK